MIATQNPDGTYTVPGHELVHRSQLGYRTSECACGWPSRPCPEWRTAVDALIDAQVAALNQVASDTGRANELLPQSEAIEGIA